MANSLTIQDILTQESQLRLPTLDSEAAFQLGVSTLNYAKSQYPNRPVVVDITTVGGATLFRSYLGQIQPDNEQWIKKKRNTVIRFEASSLRFGKELASKGRTLADKHLDPLEFTNFGGGFPLRLQNASEITIAVLCVSGLKDYEDHDAAVNGIKNAFGL